MKNLNNYTVVGQIINTRGIRGELKVLPLTSKNERFLELENVYIGDNLIPQKVSKVQITDRFIYIQFDGLNNINDVEKFKTYYIYVSDEDRVELEEGEYFISDIIGCKVYKTDETFVGEVVDLIENPANDVYVIKGEKEYLIPQVSEFVKDIDIESKKIIIDPIEGMLE